VLTGVRSSILRCMSMVSSVATTEIRSLSYDSVVAASETTSEPKNAQRYPRVPAESVAAVRRVITPAKRRLRAPDSA
jgi:hypothetical protein